MSIRSSPLLLVCRGSPNWDDGRVVRAEEIVRVVLRLDSCDAVITLLAAVGVDEAVGLVEGEHVGVDAGAEPRLECVVGGTDLRDVAFVYLGVIPVQREVEPPVVVAVGGRGGGGGDSCHFAAQGE